MKFDIVKFFTSAFLGSNNLFPLINIMYFFVLFDEVVLCMKLCWLAVD